MGVCNAFMVEEVEEEEEEEEAREHISPRACVSALHVCVCVCDWVIEYVCTIHCSGLSDSL